MLIKKIELAPQPSSTHRAHSAHEEEPRVGYCCGGGGVAGNLASGVAGGAVVGGGAGAAAGRLRVRCHVAHALLRAPIHGARGRRAVAAPAKQAPPSSLQQQRGRRR